jgi:ubiquinone/menaquinone biosynthesis C-methylase UbiE
MVTKDPYAEIAPFYDLEFDAFDADVELYMGYLQMVGGPVLELGCGTGRLLGPLAETGFSVTGLDNSESMIEIARSRKSSHGGSISLVHGDMRDLSRFGPNTFRLVFVAINSFLHLETRDDQLQALKQIRNILDRDGLLIIDVFNPTVEALARMDDRYTFDATWELPNGTSVQRYSHRQLDSGSQLITTHLFYDQIDEKWRVSRTTTKYTMRYVHRFELELLLITAGFELEGVYGSYTLDLLEHTSDQLITVAHRTANPGED